MYVIVVRVKAKIRAIRVSG